MAHFAKLGINGKVIAVLTLNNSDMLNASGVEDESVGQQYLETHNNWAAQLWIQTSYNTRNAKYYNQDGSEGDQSKAFRGNYAGIGYTWDEDNNIFLPKKPYASWVKDVSTASWKSPIGDAPALTEEQKTAMSYYQWNESEQSWDFKTKS
jgi:hypothetical protein